MGWCFTKSEQEERQDPVVVGAHNNKDYAYLKCPKCTERVSHVSVHGAPALCANCNVVVHQVQGMDVATEGWTKPLLSEIREFLSKRKHK